MTTLSENSHHHGVNLAQSLARIGIAVLVPIVLAAAAPDASAFTQWVAHCSNSRSFDPWSAKCAESGGNTGWHTVSPDGAFKSGGHDYTVVSIRTHDQFSGRSSYGSISSHLQSGVSILAGAPVGVGGDAYNSFLGSFQDTITPRGSGLGSDLTPIRFTLVLSTNLSAASDGTDGSQPWAAATAWLDLFWFGNGRRFLWTCVHANPTAACPNAKQGASELVLTGDTVLRVGQTEAFQAYHNSNSVSYAPRLPPGSTGTSFASSQSEVRLYIQPLDPRVTIESGSGFNYAPVPEPSTWALLIAGIGIVMARSMRAGKLE